MENQPTFEQHLVQTGLSSEQARLYESLVRSGPSPASDAARRANVSRTLAYKVFTELTALGLVEKRETPGKIAVFVAAHPLKLKELIERREREAKDAATALEGVLGQMTSEYNIAGGKPGVQFFEGREGIRKVLKDSLTAKSEIYTYADLESIEKYIPDVNEEYVRERERKNIKKKGIVLDTPFNRKFLADYHTAVTDTKLIKYDAPPFQTVMQMYDNKISYITLGEHMIGAIIEDPHISAMHTYLFEYVWEMTPAFTQAKEQPVRREGEPPLS